jgi:hypothetical protein
MVAVLVPSFVLASFVPVTLVAHGVVASVNMLTDCHGSTLAHPSHVAYRPAVLHLAKVSAQSHNMKLYDVMVASLVGIVVSNMISSVDAPLDALVRDDAIEFKDHGINNLLPGLPHPSFYYGGNVPTNLYNTANTAMICGAFDGSIVTPMPLGRREPCQQQQHVACKSASRFSFEYLHGIHVVNGGSSTLYCAPELEPYNKGIIPI